MSHRIHLGLVFLSWVALGACSDGDEGVVEADQMGVGAICVDDQACPDIEEQNADGEPITLVCLDQFKGGYCGLQGCTANADCPTGSACVAMDDGENYCFRQCVDKGECNENRPAEAESNCSSSVSYVESLTEGKACVPPSGN